MKDVYSNTIISVLIPVYNVEPYLHRCLDSVLSQSIDNWECVLVDDGSTDLCGKICDQYAEKDSRFHVFHRKNHGLSESRSYALQHSSGEYVVFVDSDDWLDDNYLKSMFDGFRNANDRVDIVMCDYWINNTDSQLYIANTPTNCSSKAIINDTLRRKIHAGLWSKMFRRTLLEKNGVSFSRYDYYEDMFLFVSLLHYAKKNVYLPVATYHYCYNPKSYTHDSDFQKRLHLYEEFVLNMKALNSIFKLDSEKKTAKSLDICINHDKRILILNFFSKYEAIKHLLQYFPHSMKIKYCRTFGDLCFFMASRFGFIAPYRFRAFIRSKRL